MKWESLKSFTGHEELFCGNYKITYYHYIGSHPVTEDTEEATRGYHAYFKPNGWKSWGNNIRQDRGFYPSVEAAKAGCAEHYKTYSNKPNEYDRI